MMQPTFLPWQGLFALAGTADTFVFLDDFQFQRHSFQQRNRLLVGTSETWITVPVAHPDHDFPTIAEARPLIDAKWRKRLKTTLDQRYGRAEFHGALRPHVDDWIDTEYDSLADLNIAFVQWAAETVGMRPLWRRSSEFPAAGARSERVRALLEACGAQTYLAARGSFDYMRDDGVFPVDEIDVVFQDFEPEPYRQRKVPAFVPYLSVLDALFEVGADETRALIEKGQRRWVSWDEMAATAAATRVAP